MLYVFSVYDIVFLMGILLLYIATTNILNRRYYTKRIRKIEKAIKELNKYGYTDIDIN